MKISQTKLKEAVRSSKPRGKLAKRAMRQALIAHSRALRRKA